jgi:hypothetical protein
MSQADQPVFLSSLALLKPPPDLPEDLHELYLRAATPIQTATMICSKPGGGDCSPDESAAWTEGGVAAQYGALKFGVRRLAEWATTHEAELRSEALDVYTICSRIMESLRPLLELLERSVIQLGDAPPPSAPPPGGWYVGFGGHPDISRPDPGWVTMREVWAPYQTRDATQLAGDVRSGIAAIAELRTAICVWAKKRSSGAEASLASAGALATYEKSAMVPLSTLNWREHFKTMGQCTRYLDRHEAEIHQDRSRRNRRLVHAGDWHRHWSVQERLKSEALDSDRMQEFIAKIVEGKPKQPTRGKRK